MSYGIIVRELASQLDNHIVAYDNLPQRGGCILYLDAPVRRLEITRQALDLGAQAVAAFVRQLLTEPPMISSRCSVGAQDGGLVLSCDEEAVAKIPS